MIREISPKNVWGKLKTVEVVLENPGKIFSLNLLLPSEWQIAEKVNTKITTDPERKIIIIPENFQLTSLNIFSLLHEFGHAKIDEKKDTTEIEFEIFLRDKYSYLGYGSFTESEKSAWKDIIAIEMLAWKHAFDMVNNLKKLELISEIEFEESKLAAYAANKIATYIPELDK